MYTVQMMGKTCSVPAICSITKLMSQWVLICNYSIYEACEEFITGFYFHHKMSHLQYFLRYLLSGCFEIPGFEGDPCICPLMHIIYCATIKERACHEIKKRHKAFKSIF